MGQIRSLDTFRNTKRLEYLRSFGHELDLFIANFLEENFAIDFQKLTAIYLDSMRHSREETWDYIELRDKLRTALSDACLEPLAYELRQCAWFNAALVTEEHLLERCMTLIILGRSDELARTNP